MEVLEHYAFRVTRDADFELSDDAEDLLAAMEFVLRQRTKFGAAVRLEVDAQMTPEVLQLLCRELELAPGDAYVIDGPLDLSGLQALYALRRPELKFPAFTPQTPGALAGGDDVDIFWAMRDGDVLLHHPYDSFTTTVEAFVAQAARDPHVLAIKQTLYRTGGDEAGIVASLVKAAETGKQVVALVELKARFEEQANIERARMLEQAGAHVVYGLVGLKTHAKILLVVRQEADGIRRYCHVGTGNYNPKTAVIYEDLGVLSVDDELGDDITELFNHLTGYSRPGEYRRLLVAPMHLRDELRTLIRGQAHPDGVITMKMNSLVDEEIIDELCAASVAGARVDIVVRGICCLRPGVPGVSERITVRSIVGRFLEHSRIVRFGEPGRDDTEYVIGSADMMPRNLDRRVEAMLRVSDRRLRARLDEILALNFADDALAWQPRARRNLGEGSGGTGPRRPGRAAGAGHRAYEGAQRRRLIVTKAVHEAARARDFGPGCERTGLVRAAGGVVTRGPDSALEVLVVHRPRYDDWSLPKGKVEPGETDEDAARREVEEETGYQCTLGEELATVRYIDRRGRDKQVRFWQMTRHRRGRLGAERRGRRAALDIAGGCRDTSHLRSRPRAPA